MNGIFAYVGSVPCRETVLSGIELLKKGADTQQAVRC